MTIALTPTAAIDAAIHANLNALALRLGHAEHLAVQARTAMAGGYRSLAIGTLLPLEQIIPECEALMRAVLILHRAPNVADGTSLDEVSA